MPLAGWTGALAIGLGIYVLGAVLVTAVAPDDGRALHIFSLYSDSAASIAAFLLALGAAYNPKAAAVRRTWWLLAAALGVYYIGNVHNSTYWLFDGDLFPSVGDVFFLAFYPLIFAAILSVIRATSRRVPFASTPQ